MSCTYAPSSPADAPFIGNINISKSNKKSIHRNNLSFSSQLTNSRLSFVKLPGSKRVRPATGIRAFYTENTESLYELLGIPEGNGSSVSDIKKAYREMARKYHPDVSEPDRVDENTRRFIMVREAYETLSDPRSRELYDRDLGSSKGSSFRTRPYHYHQRAEETGEWRMRWQSQLDELKHMNMKSSSRGGRMTWGARMRNQR